MKPQLWIYCLAVAVSHFAAEVANAQVNVLTTFPNKPPRVKSPTNVPPIHVSFVAPPAGTVIPGNTSIVSKLPVSFNIASLLRNITRHPADSELLFAEPILIDQPTVPENPTSNSAAPRELWGVWSTVRTENGSLSTVEFEISNRGWANVSKPSSSGKVSTSRHRVELNGNNIKLFGSNKETLAGTLIEVNVRQLVLQTKDRIITFVRRKS